MGRPPFGVGSGVGGKAVVQRLHAAGGLAQLVAGGGQGVPVALVGAVVRRGQRGVRPGGKGGLQRQKLHQPGHRAVGRHIGGGQQGRPQPWASTSVTGLPSNSLGSKNRSKAFIKAGTSLCTPVWMTLSPSLSAGDLGVHGGLVLAAAHQHQLPGGSLARMAAKMSSRYSRFFWWL